MTHVEVTTMNEAAVEDAAIVYMPELGTVSEDTLGNLIGGSYDGGWGVRLP